MNKLIIIGNLTRDPQLNTTPSGIPVCNMTVAVNRRSGQEQVADYFRVTVWRQQAESCARYLQKGSRVCCWGAVTVSTYQGNDGSPRASLELSADGVEFCGGSREQSGAGDAAEPDMPPPAATEVAYTQVEVEDVPF